MQHYVGNTVIRFGKHRGAALREVPRHYLEWAYEAMAGDADQQTAIAEYLGKWVPPTTTRVSKPAQPKQARKHTRAKRGSAVLRGCDTKEIPNRVQQFDPTSSWPDEQQWDGITPPWLDQCGSLDREYRDFIGGEL